MDRDMDIKLLATEFQDCQKVLTAIGDEVRQHLILSMMQGNDCNGMRVGDIAARTSLSRPAVSHHLQILKNAGIIKMRRDGTKNFYYFDANMDSFNKLVSMLTHAREIMLALPDRSGEND